MFLLDVPQVRTIFFIEVLLVTLKKKSNHQILLGHIKLLDDSEEARFLLWPQNPGRRLFLRGCHLRRGIQWGRKCASRVMAAWWVHNIPLTHTSTPMIVPFPNNLCYDFDLRNIFENTMYLVLVLGERNIYSTHTSKCLLYACVGLAKYGSFTFF